MTLEKRIITFCELGNYINQNPDKIKDWAYRAAQANNWFSVDNVLHSLENISKTMLNEQKLRQFVQKYDLTDALKDKKIGVVMAGNIPAVGFHDALCILLAGYQLLAKPSTQDIVLIKELLNKLVEINPDFESQIIFADKLNEADAYIATGGDNTGRYFEAYFAKKPHIIRKNRTSVAVLTGTESRIELSDLGNDIFQYFGLGCRNVSKLFVPKGYKFDTFYESIEHWNTILMHNKYNNNYDYNKSIYLVNREIFLDNGFLMLKPSKDLVSPISVIFHEEYEDEHDLNDKLNQVKIQCIVGKNYIPFGQAQCPSLSDFADGVDTMEWLSALSGQ
jgi:hypothetical protein